jgi:GDSL-like lipase/acylhydrolase family protein
MKVVLVLVGFDLLLFRVGWFWAFAPKVRGENSSTWGLLYDSVRHLEYDPRSPARAFCVGSSVLFLGVSDERVNDVLAERHVPARVTVLATFGSTATDSALMVSHALERDPWLVVYAAASRDFGKSAALDTPISRTLLDSSTDLPALAATSGEERLTRLVRRHWALYRYRTFVRAAIGERALGVAGALLAPHAPPPPAPPPPAEKLPPEALERFHFARITPDSYRAWSTWNRTRRWDDFVAWMHASGNQALNAYAAQRLDSFGPEGNRQMDSLRWMLARIRDRGVRAVVVYFPENPAFRDPAAAEYFDAALSDATARALADASAATGTRYVDLRDALPAEDFHDMIHPNLAGMRELSAQLAGIVADEWAAYARGGAVR